MRKLLLLTLLLVSVFSLSFISAGEVVYQDEDVICVAEKDDVVCNYVEAKAATGAFSIACHGCNKKTVVSGRLYDEATGEGVNNATVKITCDNGALKTKTTTSFWNGFYIVKFDDSKCTVGDTVTVQAEKDGQTGIGGPETVTDKIHSCWDFVIMNIPMVPEFGAVIGMLTMISALGVFFIVRKE